jgi:hypothetical protein
VPHEEDGGDAVAGRLLGGLGGQLRVRAQVGDPLPERAAAVLAEQLPDQRLPRPGRQLDRDVGHVRRQCVVVTQEVGLVRPQVPDAAVARPKRAE